MDDRQSGQHVTRVELVPGALWVDVALVEVHSGAATWPCWSYVTDGLGAVGQKELALVLLRRTDDRPDDYPQDPLRLFALILDLARGGRIVYSGDVTEFGPTGFLGRTALRAIGYLRPDGTIEGVAPDVALQGILLTDDEAQIARSHGLTRVMAQLGNAYRHFPYPPWSDRDRQPVITLVKAQASVLEQIPRLRIQGATILDRRVEGQLELTLPTASAPILRQNLSQLPSSSPLALLTDLDPRANACLAWVPGTESYAIAPSASDGSRTSGCFLGFVPEQASDGAKIVEDGVVLLLRSTIWTRVRDGLMREQPTAVGLGPEGASFSLRWTS